MKLFSTIKKAVSKIPAKLAIFLAIAFLGLGVAHIAKAEFYPDRPTFDYNKAPVNGTTCTTADKDARNRCGSMTGPVFNSFVNTPSYGDERAFLDARRSDQTAEGSYKNELANVTEGSREVVLRTYIHNNGNQDLNASGVSVAKNAKVRIALPTAESQALRARSYISADNAALVEDTVDLVGGQNFRVEYIPGSAKLYNYGPFKNGTAISDSVVTTGAPIGYDAMNGNLPGCFDYAATVQIRVRIIVKQTPKLTVNKEVRKAGEKEWKKEVSAKPGEKVEWLITAQNTGPTVQNNMIVRDVPAPNNTLVSGSVRWIDVNQNAAQTDKPLFDGGINVGNYGSNGGFYMMYASTVDGNFKECEARVRNQAFVRSDQVTEIGDTADVIITRENCNPPKNPIYTCDGLTQEKIGDRSFRYKVSYTAQNGATLKFISYNFGDGSQNFMTDKTTVEHTYAKDGTFVTRATLTFSVNGQDKVVEAGKCAVPVTLTSTPPVTPEVPGKELPNTGAGDILGLFGATSLIGAVLHRLYVARRA